MATTQIAAQMLGKLPVRTDVRAARRRRVDPREGAERGLERRLLPPRTEVRAHALLQISGLADVQGLSVGVAQHVDPRPGGHLRGVASSRLRAHGARRRRDRARPRPCGPPAPVRCRAAASSSSPVAWRRAMRGGTGRSAARSDQPASAGRSAARGPRAGVVRARPCRAPAARGAARRWRRARAAGSRRRSGRCGRRARSPRARRSRSRSAGPTGPAPRRSRWWMPVMDVITGGSGTPGSTSRSKVATGSSPSILTAPISTMRAPRPTPVVSRSTTQKRACSSGVSARRRPVRPAPCRRRRTRQSRVSDRTTSCSRRLTSSRRRATQGEQPACRFLRSERLAMRDQRIDQPVSATEREL